MACLLAFPSARTGPWGIRIRCTFRTRALRHLLLLEVPVPLVLPAYHSNHIHCRRCLSLSRTQHNTHTLHNIQVPLTSLAVPLPQLIVFLHLFYVSAHPTTAPNTTTTTTTAAAAAVHPGTSSDAVSSSSSPLLLWLDSCHGDPWIWMAVAVVPGFVVALVWYLQLIRSGSIKVRKRRRDERVRKKG